MNIDRQLGFQLGEWSVHPDQGLLVGVKGELHLEPKVMEVLIYLAERQDEVVRRDDLINDVWHGTFVSDEVLSRAISLLRACLGDDRMTPRYIQTLPKVGYRLLMEVTPLVVPEPKQESRSQQQENRVIKLVLAIGAAIIVIVTVAQWADKETAVDPRSPAAVASISERFDFLAEEKEGAKVVTSIAVLPFVNMSDDPGNEYFSDGISEELLNLLAKIPELRVIARMSSFAYKGTTTKIADVARELNVDHVLEGSVRKAGNHVRITAQLIRASDSSHLWSETYNRQLNDIFVIQDEIAAAVVAQLKMTLLGAAPTVNAANPQVFALYLQGRHLSKQGTATGSEIERALQLEPANTDILGAAANLFASLGRLDEALALSEFVVSRDPGSHGDHFILGLYYTSAGRWQPFLENIGTSPEQLAAIDFKVTLP